MSAGGDFTLLPQLVTELEPSYNTVDHRYGEHENGHSNTSSTPILRYRLNFKALTTANKDTLLVTRKTVWRISLLRVKSVPTYIGSGANITGRWLRGR